MHKVYNCAKHLVYYLFVAIYFFSYRFILYFLTVSRNMFKLTGHFSLVLLLIIPTITLLQKATVLAEEDAAEDETIMEDDEGEVETEEDDQGTVEEDGESVGDSQISSNEEEDEPEVITAHKEAETAIIFNSGLEPSIVAGKKASAYIHFANKGSSNFIITSIDGSFRYPQDFSYVIQNFTVISPNKMIDAGYEGSFHYKFLPGELSGGRSFGLIINVNYKDTEENIYRDAVYNQTIQVLENEEGLDTETFFMYLMLLAMAGLLLLGAFHAITSRTRRGKKRNVQNTNHVPVGKSPLEVGTTNGPVDYTWIPEETLKAMNKGTPSPRRSPRKRAGKQSATE